MSVIFGTQVAQAHSSGAGNLGPMHDIGIGPSGAYLFDGAHGGAINIDVSYSIALFTASTNLKLIVVDDRILAGPQLELTFWLFANIGGGVGYLGGSENGPVYHLFVGVPMGDNWLPKWFEPFNGIYFEPFYRLNYFDPGEGRVMHEVGLMIKITTWTI